MERHSLENGENHGSCLFRYSNSLKNSFENQNTKPMQRLNAIINHVVLAPTATSAPTAATATYSLADVVRRQSFLSAPFHTVTPTRTHWFLSFLMCPLVSLWTGWQAKHNTESDCWIVVDGQVLDVSSFLDKVCALGCCWVTSFVWVSIVIFQCVCMHARVLSWVCYLWPSSTLAARVSSWRWRAKVSTRSSMSSRWLSFSYL